MTGTAVQTIPTNLPAFLQRQDVVQQAEKFNAAAMGGIKTGGFPRISLSGSKFFILDNSAEVPRQLITVKDPSGTVDVPAMVLSVVVVGANPGISKLYYEGPYVAGDDREPDCSSDDGLRPDPHIAEPMNNACATCPMNAWGSRTTPQGKEGKACADGKRLVVIPAGHLSYKAMALNITPAMLKDWGAYVRALSSKGIPVHGVVTRLMFDPTVDYPKLNFTFERFLSEDEFAVVEKRMDSDEVRNIEKPVRTAAPTPAALPAPAAAIPAPPAHIAPPTPPAAPAPAPAPAPSASFGTSAAPAPAPVQPTTIAPLPEAPPAPVDPLAGLPPEVVAAINTVGGITSAAGAAIATAARNAANPQPDPAIAQAAAAVANAEPPKSGRGRPRKNAAPEAAPPAPPPAAPTAPPPAAAAPVPPPPPPAAPAQTGFSASPAAVVVAPGGGVANQLDSLLAGIMGG